MYRFKCKKCGTHLLEEVSYSVRPMAVHSVEGHCPMLLAGAKHTDTRTLMCGRCTATVGPSDESSKLWDDGWLEKLPNVKIINLKDLPTTDVRMPNGSLRKVTNWDVMSVLLGKEDAERIKKMKPRKDKRNVKA